MESNNTGSSSSPRETAAEIARKKVLAVYSSTLESLKKSSAERDHNNYTQNYQGNEYIASPQPQTYTGLDDFDISSSLAEPTIPSIDSTPSFQDNGNEPGALKELPVNQTNINNEWQQYHSAWQNYYQNYYNDYYAKAAQNYLATEKLKSERIATGKTQGKRHAIRTLPAVIILIVATVFLFMQYNRMIFAPIMAYVAPSTDVVASSIEAVDPTVTQAVSPEPRLIIPKLNIDVPVAFGISLSEVDSAMNHGVAQFMIPGANAMPGEVGNLVLSGHSAGDIYSSNPYKFIFSGLERLEDGDLIYVNYNSVRYTYQMTKSEVVEPTDVSALIYPTQKPILTLITCTPLGTSRYRLLIVAEQISPSFDYSEGGDNDLGDNTSTMPEDVSMPANQPTFFESIWSGLFGN